jgi:hypothetical protein
MKKMLLTSLSLITCIYAIESGISCKIVKKDDFKTILNDNNVTIKPFTAQKFPHTDSCHIYTQKSKILPTVQVYYYDNKKDLSSYAIYTTTNKIKGIKDAIEVIAGDRKDTIVQLITYTKKGAVSLVFVNSITKDSKEYKEALKLLDKISQSAP